MSRRFRVKRGERCGRSVERPDELPLPLPRLPLHVRSVKLQRLTPLQDFISPAVFQQLLWPSGPLPLPGERRAGGERACGPGYSWTNRRWVDSRRKIGQPLTATPESLCGRLCPKHVQSLPIIISSSHCALSQCLKIYTPKNLQYRIRDVLSERTWVNVAVVTSDTHVWLKARWLRGLFSVSECRGPRGQSAACMSGWHACCACLCLMSETQELGSY